MLRLNGIEYLIEFIKKKKRYFSFSMYFGGYTRDYKPNQYIRQDHVAHYDHLWAGYENGPEVNESLKRQQYGEDLKRQIAEKKERDKVEKSTRNSEQMFSVKSTNNYIKQNSYNSTIPDSYHSKIKDGISRPIVSNFRHSISSTSSSISTVNNFAETLRAQIDDCRRSSYSALAQPIQPLSSSQPIPTFAASTSFNSAQFEIPNISHSFRSNKLMNGRQSQVRSVSMKATSSLRSSIDQSSIQPPIINAQSPLNRSKVATPSIGFSTRTFRSKNTNFFQDTTPIPPSFPLSTIDTSSTTSGAQSRLNSNYQDFNVSSLAHTMQPIYQQEFVMPKAPLLSESQMIYPDGYGSPI